MENVKKNKITYYTIIFALSIVNIFFAFEGSFTIQSILPLIAILILLFLIQKKEKLILSKPSKILFLLSLEYAIAMGINFFRYNINAYSMIQLLYQFVIFCWFFILTQHDYSKKEIQKYCKVLILVFLICGLYVFYSNYFLKQTTFSITTVFGKLIGKNHFSAWISLAITFTFYFLIYSKKKFLYLITLFLLAMSIIFMNSRGAILSSLLCCGLIFIQYILRNGITAKKIAVIFLMTISAVIGYKVAIDIMPQWLYNRYFVKSYVDDSNADRVYRWKNAFEGIKEHPIFGFGPGVFSSLEEYKITDFGKEINSSTPSHNTFIDVVLNGGIVGLILFLLFLFSIFKEFIYRQKIYLPIVLHVLVNSMILGAGKTVYFWNTIILLYIISNYTKNKINENVFEDIEENGGKSA